MAKKVVGHRKKKKKSVKTFIYYELIGLSLILFSVIGIMSLGVVGKAAKWFAVFFVGAWSSVFLLIVGILGVYLVITRKIPKFGSKRSIGMLLIGIALLMYSHMKLFDQMTKQGEFVNGSIIINTWELFWLQIKGQTSTIDYGGGMAGAVLYAVFFMLFDNIGTKLSIVFLILIGITLTINQSFRDLISKGMNPITKYMKAIATDIATDYEKVASKKPKKVVVQDSNIIEDEEEITEEFPIIYAVEPEVEVAEVAPKVEKMKKTEITESGRTVKVKINEQNQDVDGGMDLAFTSPKRVYHLPKLDLLVKPEAKQEQNDQNKIFEKAKILERTFQSFGVKAKVTKVHVGPAVTKFEVNPDVGVKVSKIVSLSDDLALALAARDIRIEAPIPGKSAVGIEVPNSEISIVTLREVLESTNKQKKDSKLYIGLGRDISGEVIGAELDKMPHLLVAGATGSGKSVCINGIIISILMRAKPHEVKLMMIDPKMVELNIYNGIPHLLAPVVTDPKKASVALKRVVQEMERRYEQFSSVGARNIEGYNDYLTKVNSDDGKMPFIVVIVDELADLMMVASADVEDSITRLSQMARAAGIHLIIATQRPSVDVITGVIKANIPSRIAFAVSSQVDSRTILDSAGAEKLLGRGDMLYMPIGSNKPTRVQGAYINDEEVEKIVNAVISQQKAQYQEEMMVNEETITRAHDMEDDLYEEAVQLVVNMQTASVSMLQRRFRVGYARAARLIDMMEQNGVVGQYEGSKPREVLMKDFEIPMKGN